MKPTDLRGKRILFLAPTFFNYESIIANKMRDMGADVDFYNVRSVSSALSRALLKVSSRLFKKRTRLYYEEILKKNSRKQYDYVLIIKCDMTPKGFLAQLKTVFPDAKLCLYLWDSVDNIPGITDKLSYFDTAHSFDLEDCKTHPELKFRPLFFSDQYRKDIENNKDYNYDLSFIGTVHSDRYSVIKRIQNLALENNLNCYWFLYLQSKFIYWFYRFTKKEFWRAPKSAFSFVKMPAEKIAEVVDNSKIILDIQHPKQTGLTMRTIEMLGMNKKLITTNKGIKDYDFYCTNNIVVINRKNVTIPIDFFSEPYRPIPTSVYEKYSLNSWILDVLD